MSDFHEQYPESAKLLKRLGAPSPERVPEPPTEDPTSTGYKGILLTIWLLGMIFIAVPFMVESCSGKPDDQPCLTCVRVP